ERLRELSIETLRLEIERCVQLGIPALVLHPGAHLGAGEAAGLARVAEALDRVLARGRLRRAGIRVLLELTAGQGTQLGHRFEQLAEVLAAARCAGRLGVCFDTCHALAAGYDLRTAEGYRETFDAFQRTLGLDRLAAFHLNDSRGRLGCRRDRHEHIGCGHVGREGFRRLLVDPRFAGLPMVLETPKGDDLTEDRVNLAQLRELLAPVAS
ncbi:MAG TPA: deoxyribonuclease IV, partial [Candidatus Polarisedimenticolaceae bacterium]|nr:deoxyribonuclease IV [Candidatus Polarisedimenticolaceae bacterium]